MQPAIVWFHHDLRIQDNLALKAAEETGRPIVALYVYNPESAYPTGGASKWWLHYSLQSLQRDLNKHNVQLVIRKGTPTEQIKQLLKETKATHLFWGRQYSAEAIEIGKALKVHCKDNNITAESFNNALLFEPWEVKSKEGEPYRVFTPFWKTAISQKSSFEITNVDQLHGYKKISSHTVDDLTLLDARWASKFDAYWEPGEKGAWKRLEAFISDKIDIYKKDRDFLSIDATSKLSPHLHFGEISPRQVWREVAANTDIFLKNPAHFLSEIGWREFSYSLLYYFPQLSRKNWRDNFNNMPWKKNSTHLKAWQQGQTGIPIIDAAMRQLWETGWMHNRARMIVASFLTKNLGIHWKEGCKWFEDTLVDADEANNSAGWQWVAGSGADAAPYFRIFNPVTQAEKFDAEASYINEWVPELKDLNAPEIFAPWKYEDALKKENITLGKDYPLPIVNLQLSREEALQRYEEHVKLAQT